jgi:hypothetical protein
LGPAAGFSRAFGLLALWREVPVHIHGASFAFIHARAESSRRQKWMDCGVNKTSEARSLVPIVTPLLAAWMTEPSDNVGAAEAADAVDENPHLNLLLLPSDVLALMLSALANVSCVARFGHVSHASLAIVRDARFIALCASKMNVPPPADDSHALKKLAMHQAVLENIGALPWLLFKPGGAELKPGEDPRCARAATLLRRFDDATLEIEGHAAAAAPVDTAQSLSHNRAIAVLRALLGRGAPRQRLAARAWGRQLSVGWPDDETTARAEVYFELRGEHIPARPVEYCCSMLPPAISEHDWPSVTALERSSVGGGGSGGGRERPPDITSRRGLLQMMRQVRAEKQGSRPVA